MFKPEAISSLGQQLLELLPPSVVETQKDLEKNVQALVQSTFARLDLVTRSEFDAQSAVLQRTRAKLEALEKQLEALEGQIEARKSE